MQQLTKVKTKVASSRNTNLFTLREAALFQNGSICAITSNIFRIIKEMIFHKLTDLAREDTELLVQVLTPSCCWALEADEEEEEADEDNFSPHFIEQPFSGAGACASF